MCSLWTPLSNPKEGDGSAMFFRRARSFMAGLKLLPVLLEVDLELELRDWPMQPKITRAETHATLDREGVITFKTTALALLRRPCGPSDRRGSLPTISQPHHAPRSHNTTGCNVEPFRGERPSHRWHRHLQPTHAFLASNKSPN